MWEEEFHHHRRTDHDTLVLAGDCRPPRAVDSDLAWAGEEATEQLWGDGNPVTETGAIRRAVATALRDWRDQTDWSPRWVRTAWGGRSGSGLYLNTNLTVTWQDIRTWAGETAQ